MRISRAGTSTSKDTFTTVHTVPAEEVALAREYEHLMKASPTVLSEYTSILGLVRGILDITVYSFPTQEEMQAHYGTPSNTYN